MAASEQVFRKVQVKVEEVVDKIAERERESVPLHKVLVAEKKARARALTDNICLQRDMIIAFGGKKRLGCYWLKKRPSGKIARW